MLIQSLFQSLDIGRHSICVQICVFLFFLQDLSPNTYKAMYTYIQIQGYIQTLTYLIFYSTNFVDMVCIFLFLLHISICF